MFTQPDPRPIKTDKKLSCIEYFGGVHTTQTLHRVPRKFIGISRSRCLSMCQAV